VPACANRLPFFETSQKEDAANSRRPFSAQLARPGRKRLVAKQVYRNMRCSCAPSTDVSKVSGTEDATFILIAAQRDFRPVATQRWVHAIAVASIRFDAHAPAIGFTPDTTGRPRCFGSELRRERIHALQQTASLFNQFVGAGVVLLNADRRAKSWRSSRRLPLWSQRRWRSSGY
jgi:hypothetical protein